MNTKDRQEGNKMLQNRKSLMSVLKGIVENSKRVESRAFATALLYLVNEIVPEDRTTKRIIENIGKEI